MSSRWTGKLLTLSTPGNDNILSACFSPPRHHNVVWLCNRQQVLSQTVFICSLKSQFLQNKWERGQISLADSLLLLEPYYIIRVLHVSCLTKRHLSTISLCGICLKYIHIHGFHKLWSIPRYANQYFSHTITQIKFLNLTIFSFECWSPSVHMSVTPFLPIAD